MAIETGSASEFSGRRCVPRWFSSYRRIVMVAVIGDELSDRD
jgi:hypothetical protein